MRLELAEFPVASIKLADQFHYAAGQLTVDKSAIEQSVLQEGRIEAAWLDVVSPGDKVRITGIRDVVEPRVKVSGSGQVFPGVLGPVQPIGE
ncbi:MAG: glycine/sarcosine/betaine reductase component B subunit, partial [Candidatus Binatota bacterium]|nr:glycine/sarcosine/betaine reductase component B subunit [Candidatus Binatota bacterium]